MEEEQEEGRKNKKTVILKRLNRKGRKDREKQF